MKRFIATVVIIVFLTLSFASLAEAATVPVVKLGNEVLLEKYRGLIEGKRLGLITNQTGVNSKGISTLEVLAADPTLNLTAIYTPEHGLDGKAKAGAYVESYQHEKLGIPVYSLYGETRMPTENMLKNVDVLLYDIQDIGARSYTYISTLNYCMVAAAKYNKQIIILDRPNPLGGVIVEGPVLEDPYKSFVGVDNLPMAHGMTVGELAHFFNRKIGANFVVIPMEGYTRDMVFQDTGLPWVQTSPNIPDLDSAFGYMATGLGEGTGIFQADKFKWIGGKGIDAFKFAELLNNSNLPGVEFIPEIRGEAGGVRLKITDYHTFNPAKTGIYALTYAHSLNNFTVPKSGKTIVMFDKIMGTNKIGQYLEQGLTPQQIESKYATELERFKQEREQYLIYGYGEKADSRGGSGRQEEIQVVVNGERVQFDTAPYLDGANRLQVPLRAIVEALNAELSWDPDKMDIRIVQNGQEIKFTIGSNIAELGGEKRIMDTSPIIKNNRTMIPLRYVGEYLGCEVNWNAQLRVAEINS
ncbi:MAG TPA: DUF1343 domain-containing protein [Clostridia bacterium]|nr:DUF1343 domain-containing protein [Clostridia bacterium]